MVEIDTRPQKLARLESREPATRSGFFKFDGDHLDINEFKALTSRKTDAGALRFASSVEKNIPIYDCSKLQETLSDPETKERLMTEWAWVFLEGPGVLVLQGAFTNSAAIDEATKVFLNIIAGQSGGADHFAAKGANDRIWNAHQKLCLKSPEVFASYWNNPFVDAVNEAWLGPGYQMTTQVNVVRPGGKAQDPHRDFHLGFQTAEHCSKFPAHVHQSVSPLLTLQGAVAHVDMPEESGTTFLLPFSHMYPQGYLAWHRPEFQAHFAANYVQLPLKKGDCLFFNPALFHAGGENRTSNVQRIVNLMQASSAFGRSMETLDRTQMSKALFPALSKTFSVDPSGAKLAVLMCAEGYSFPTNLDSDPPENGRAPPTQQSIFIKALEQAWTSEELEAALEAQCMRQKS